MYILHITLLLLLHNNFGKRGVPMNRQLLQEVKHLLEQQLPADAAIHLSMVHIQPELHAMADNLSAYEMEHRDRCVILGSYWLLLQAIHTHRNLSQQDPQEIARAVLDGDFLQSFYLQFAMRHQHTDLVIHLAPVLKQIFIKQAEGNYSHDLLTPQLYSYISKRYSRRHMTPKRYKQVTYDVI